MIWRRVTAGLLCACAATPAAMYLRDLGAAPPQATAGEAQFDAGRVLAALSPNCGTRCSVQMLGMSAAHTWRVRLSTGAWQACYDLDPSALRYSTDRGFVAGVRRSACSL